MVTFANRAKVSTSTTGTGTITLGTAVDGYQSFTDAGVVNSDVVRYTIEDGDAWEIGSGTYSAGTLTRVLDESSTGSLLNLSGEAVVYVTAAGEDIVQPSDLATVATSGAYSDLSGLPTLGTAAAADTGDFATAAQGALADSAVQPNDSPSFGSVTVSGTVDGRDIAADGSKLDGIEAGATADQTAGEIKTAYESNANTNAFTDAEQTKLAGIEATADVTDAGNVNPLVDAHLNTSSATTGEYLSWTGSDYDWVAVSGYTDADVDTHLNTGTASSGEVLSWNGTDYDWIAAPAALDGQTDSASPFETSLGFEAGLNTTGAGNTFTGYQAGKANTTGGYNTSVGYLSGTSLNASQNATLGSFSGRFVTSGGSNTLIGTSAGSAITTGSGNVALGKGAMDAATTGGRNIAIGLDAMGSGVATTTNGYNVAIGYLAGSAITTATNNIGIGFRPLVSATSGGINIGLGVDPLFSLSTGTNNTALGQLAGYSITTGSNNVALGNGALDAATTGGRNIAIGQDAMGAGVATAASGYNVAIGYESGYDLTSGIGNILTGESCGPNLTTGIYNIFSGRRAGFTATTATYNVALGFNALYENNSTGNIAFGYRAAAEVRGDYNIAIGHNSNTGFIPTGDNTITVGYDAQLSDRTVSNEITLGNTSITRFRVPGAGIDNTSAALSGTTPSVDVGARDTYTLTTSGNTTFTFTGVPSSGQVGTFSLIITAGGTHTLTWPASVDWAGGTAPDAPASGEKDIYTFMTVDGGTTWYGFLAGDAMA